MSLIGSWLGLWLLSLTSITRTNKNTIFDEKIEVSVTYNLRVDVRVFPFQVKRQQHVGITEEEMEQLYSAEIESKEKYLFNVVTCFSTCFDKHNIQFFSFSFSIFSWNLSFVRQISFISNYETTDQSLMEKRFDLPSMMITSLPRSVRTSSIHLDVCWNELESEK